MYGRKNQNAQKNTVAAVSVQVVAVHRGGGGNSLTVTTQIRKCGNCGCIAT